MSVTDTQVFLTSNTGITAGQILYFDREAMSVRSVLLTGAVSVFRATNATSLLAHAAGLTVYFGSPDKFLIAEPRGQCAAAPTAVFTRLPSGEQYTCTAYSWAKVGTGGTTSIASMTTPGLIKASVDIAIDPVTGAATIANKAVFPASSGLLCYDATQPTLATALSIAVNGACSVGGGGGGASLTSAISPSSVSVVQGQAAAPYTLTYTAFGLAGVPITPTCTGLPTGATVAFNPLTVAATGGTTAATVTTSGSTPAATSTLSCTGTSGGTTSNASTASLVITAPTGSLTLGAPGTFTNPYALTGNVDWFLPKDAPGALPFLERKSGGAIFGSQNATTSASTYSGGASVTWTDGNGAFTGTGSGSRVGEEYGPGAVFTFTVQASPTSRTVTILTAKGDSGSGAWSITAHSANSSVPDVSTTVTTDSTLRTTSFTLQDANSGVVTFTLTATSYPVLYAAYAN